MAGQQEKMQKSNKEGKRAVYLPAELYDKIDEIARSSEFGSIEEYIKYVVEEIIKEKEIVRKSSAFSQEEEERLKSRLRSMGYL